MKDASQLSLVLEKYDAVIHVSHIVFDLKILFDIVIKALKIEIRKPLRSIVSDRDASVCRRSIKIDYLLNQEKESLVFYKSFKFIKQNLPINSVEEFLNVEFEDI